MYFIVELKNAVISIIQNVFLYFLDQKYKNTEGIKLKMHQNV
jgi:hypothetical protein